MKLTFGSVCSGIEAASVAWEPLGWKALWLAEIEEFPSAVLAHHWPNVPNLGDMTTIKSMGVPSPDVLIGGTPCQAFSVAGLGNSLDDERGQLTLEYVRLLNSIDEKRESDGKLPAIGVWENVPGCLNTKDNAFGCLLGALCGEEEPLIPSGKKWTNAGYVLGPQRAVAWRILDAQYFGVAQRRRRVFIVTSAREGFDPREVLFEFEGVRRDTKPSRTAREVVAADIREGTKEGVLEEIVCVHGTQDPCIAKEHAHTLGRNNGQENVICIQDKATRHSGKSGKGLGNGLGISESGVMFTLTTGDRHAVAHSIIADVTPKIGKEICGTLRALGGGGIVPPSVSSIDPKSKTYRVRRLLPVECERLQGFPDNHTDVYFGKPKHSDQKAPDGHRYKALGNSMAVPVIEWIGKRIEMEIKRCQK